MVCDFLVYPFPSLPLRMVRSLRHPFIALTLFYPLDTCFRFWWARKRILPRDAIHPPFMTIFRAYCYRMGHT